MPTLLRGPPTAALRARLGSEGLLKELPASTLEALLPSLEWLHADGGEQILANGQPCQGMFILVSGRLEVVGDSGELLGPVNPGEPVGEMSLLSDQPHSATVRAARDSILVRLSASTFPTVVQTQPAVLLALCRIMVQRLKERRSTPLVSRRAIAIIAATPYAPVRELAAALSAELQMHGRVRMIDHLVVDDAIGPGTANAPRGSVEAAHLSDFVHDAECESDQVLLVADDPESAWSARCARHADLVLLVAHAHRAPAAFPALRRTHSTARHELVLLHPTSTSRPTGATAWRAVVPADGHHHVRVEHPGDVARLARHLGGRSVSLVLAGGAVRGFAHLGVLTALEESGIPIDLIAGTSIGAVVGSLVAWGLNASEIRREMHDAFVKRSMIDLTTPIVAVMAGRRMERWTQSMFGDAPIEDLWRPFRAVSSSLLRAKRVVHRDGLLRIALRASVSVPGLLPPVVLGNDVLVDGLTMDNLPIDVAQTDTRGRIIAANVVPPAAQDHLLALAKRSSLSHLVHMLDPRQPERQAPLFQFLMQANFLSTIGHAERVRQIADVFIEPPVGHLGFIGSAVFDEAVRLGEDAARAALRGFKV